MAMGLANLLRPEPFKCKKKGDSEQLLQDFKEYRSKMELFFTAAQTVEAHTQDPAGRTQSVHLMPAGESHGGDVGGRGDEQVV